MTIINDDSRVVNKLEASVTDNAWVVIYDRLMFIVQATDLKTQKNLNILKIFVIKLRIAGFQDEKYPNVWNKFWSFGAKTKQKVGSCRKNPAFNN